MAQNKNFFSRYFSVAGIVTILVGLVLFGVSKYIIHEYGFYVSREISINDFILILVTIVISIVIPFTAGSLVENRKTSRELLIKLCDKIQNDLRILKQIASASSDGEKDRYINEIIEIMGYTSDGCEKLRKNITAECSDFDTNSLITKTDDLKTFSTDNLRDTTFSFSDLYKTETKRKINHLDNELEDAKFSINNLLS